MRGALSKSRATFLFVPWPCYVLAKGAVISSITGAERKPSRMAFTGGECTQGERSANRGGKASPRCGTVECRVSRRIHVFTGGGGRRTPGTGASILPSESRFTDQVEELGVCLGVGM